MIIVIVEKTLTMGPPLRRSSRGTPKKTSSYSVGDVVEVRNVFSSVVGDNNIIEASDFG